MGMFSRQGDHWTLPAGRVLSIPLVITSVMFNVTTGDTAESEIRRMRIESDPAGAAVSSIVGRLGVTPISISERDIYPNAYPNAKVDLYGKVVISKTGCKTITRRVTPGDIKRGLDIQLDCAVPVSTVDNEVEGKPQVIQKSRDSASSISEPLSERRLRQLKVLNELLDDGLISEEEERAIRKRIFERHSQ